MRYLKRLWRRLMLADNWPTGDELVRMQGDAYDRKGLFQ